MHLWAPWRPWASVQWGTLSLGAAGAGYAQSLQPLLDRHTWHRPSVAFVAFPSLTRSLTLYPWLTETLSGASFPRLGIEPQPLCFPRAEDGVFHSQAPS